MADWSIDPWFHEEPTHVPTGECNAWARGDLCGHSDCRECGPAVAQHLLAEARAGFQGFMRLAREVGRIAEKYGDNIPDGPVVIGDVANACATFVFGCTWHLLCGYDYSACCAWAEGIVDAVHGTPAPTSARDCFVTDHERWCYFLGRVAPALRRLHIHLRVRAAQHMAAFAGRAFGAMANAQEVK